MLTDLQKQNILKGIRESQWSPASGPVVWNDEKFATAEAQANHLLDYIVSIVEEPTIAPSSADDIQSDGSVLRYMDLTDFYYEFDAAGGVRVFHSEGDLRKNHPCIEECGILLVSIKAERIIRPSTI